MASYSPNPDRLSGLNCNRHYLYLAPDFYYIWQLTDATEYTTQLANVGNFYMQIHTGHHILLVGMRVNPHDINVIIGK
jgi:hypothetical protein